MVSRAEKRLRLHHTYTPQLLHVPLLSVPLKVLLHIGTVPRAHEKILENISKHFKQNK